jgi:hypothetical protein
MFKINLLLLPLLAGWSKAQAIVNGQIYTPGIVLVDAPQPNTPLGGGEFYLSLSVEAGPNPSR